MLLEIVSDFSEDHIVTFAILKAGYVQYLDFDIYYLLCNEIQENID